MPEGVGIFHQNAASNPRLGVLQRDAMQAAVESLLEAVAELVHQIANRMGVKYNTQVPAQLLGVADPAFARQTFLSLLTFA
jgi:hypothetical protein